MWVIAYQPKGQKTPKWIGIAGVVRSRKDAQVYSTREQADLVVKTYHQNYNIPLNNLFLKDAKTSRSKCNNQPCWVTSEGMIIDAVEGIKVENSEWFTSKLEARVYLILLKFFERKDIYRQYPLEVKPATPVYPRIEWKVDFHINSLELNIEAKGEALPEFKRNLQYYQYFNQKLFHNLIVVGNLRERIDRVVTRLSFDEFEQTILQLKNIKKGVLVK